ncbi:unnamed protein product, partial [Medioppia subpectinata]
MSDRLVSAKTSATITAKDDGQSLTYESILESFVRQKSFKCHYDGCDKCFCTQRHLDSHIRRRHAVDGTAQSGELIGNSSSDSRRIAAADDSKQLVSERRPIAIASPVLPPITFRSDDNFITTTTASNTYSSATSGQTSLNGQHMLQTLRDPRLRKRYGLPLVATCAGDNSPINTSHTINSQTIVTSIDDRNPSGQSSAAIKPVVKVGAGSHSAPNACLMNTIETNTRKRGRHRGTAAVQALASTSTTGDQSSAGKHRKVKAKHRRRRRRSSGRRKRRKQDTDDHHLLLILSTDEDTNSDSEVEIIGDDSQSVKPTVPPLTTSPMAAMADNPESDDDSDIEIVAIVSAPTAQTTGAATAGPSKLSPPPVVQSLPVLPQMAPPLLPPPPPPSTAVDTAILVLAIPQTVPNEEIPLSVASDPTISTTTPVPYDMDTDIDGELLYPPEDNLPTDDYSDYLLTTEALPNSDYYTRFDSLAERVCRVVEANTTADDCDVKPVIATENHTDITCDIKLDVNAFADNTSPPDVTTDSVWSAPGDSEPAITSEPVVVILKLDTTDVSATDQTLADDKPLLLTDPRLQTLSDPSLATTLSTQSEDTDSVEQVVSDILALLVNTTANANRDEQSCVGTTPIGAVISNTDSQTIATTNHKNCDTNTSEEVTVSEEMGVNSGQEFSAQLTAPEDVVDSSNQSITVSTTDVNNPMETSSLRHVDITISSGEMVVNSIETSPLLTAPAFAVTPEEAMDQLLTVDTTTISDISCDEYDGRKIGGQLTAAADEEVREEGVDNNHSFSPISSTVCNSTAISDHKNSGEEVAKETVPATIGPQRDRHLTLEHYRRHKKRLREAFGVKRGDDSDHSDTNSDSDGNSGQSLTPFDGLLLDVSKRMASKIPDHSTTGHRSSATRSTSTGSGHHSNSGQRPEPLPKAK